ncbi:MAG TPA: flagellar hook-basal body complex protein FliE [Clostridia bacterium]|nr:flagellar hook-basal body complex protein FliE [Clostridia bacterium]
MKINFPAQAINVDNSTNISPATGSAKVSFADFLNNALSEVNNLQLESEQLNEAFAMGKNDNIHQVMIAAEKADMALQLTIQLRNKVLEAYQEIMRMSV